MPTQTQQFAGQLMDPMADKEFKNILAAIDSINRWGQWTNVPYASGLFVSDSGTWTVLAEHMKRFKWTVIGRTMLVDLLITSPAITGTVKYLRCRIPNSGYRVMPAPVGAAAPSYGAITNSAAQSCIVSDNSTPGLGAIQADGAISNAIVIVANKYDASAFTNTAGIIAQLALEVQPQ